MNTPSARLVGNINKMKINFNKRPASLKMNTKALRENDFTSDAGD